MPKLSDKDLDEMFGKNIEEFHRKMVESINSENSKTSEDRYKASQLSFYLSLETWSEFEGLLIICGIEPSGASIDGNYENFIGVRINNPKINNAEFFGERDYYDDLSQSEIERMVETRQANIRAIKHSLDPTQVNFHSPETMKDLESQLKNEEWSLKISEEMKDSDHTWLVRDLRARYEHRLGEVRKIWDSGVHEIRNPPHYYVNWALSKDIDICWYEWATNAGHISLPDTGKYRISKKTENAYLDIISVLSQALIGENLSDKPYSDAGKVERKLSKNGMQLPCSMETLGKYLKEANK